MKSHIYKESILVRPDNSKFYLQFFKNQGYTQVVFRANPTCCPKECRPLDGNIYLIDDLLTFDNPLFRTAHPNCNCRFDPYGPKKTKESTPSKNWWDKTKEKGKDIWKKINPFEWFKKKKSSCDYKRDIYRKANRIKLARNYKTKILKMAKWI